MKENIDCFNSRLLLLFLTACFSLFFSCNTEILPESEQSATPVYAETERKSHPGLRKLVRGAAIQSSNGVRVGPNGHLYIASVSGQEIVVMNKYSGKIVNRLGAEVGILCPDDLVFGPDGSLYWTDIQIGEVGRLAPDGKVTKQFVALGVNPITFSPEGRLFVALDFQGDGLFELDPNLVNPPRPIVMATSENPLPLGFLNSFDFGPDGQLYGPLYAAGLVVRVAVGNPGDPVSTDPFADGIVHVVADGFKDPVAAKFGPDSLLYVLDQTGEVFKIDVRTGEKRLFTFIEPGLDNLIFDQDGTLYVTSTDQGSVFKVFPSGFFRTIRRGGMILPQGLAVIKDAHGRDALFEADLFRLRKFDVRTGRQKGSYRAAIVPEGPQSLVLPMNLSADGENLIVTSWFSGAVQVWNPERGVIENYDDFEGPIDAVRFKDDILVSDLQLGGVLWASSQAMVLPIDNATVFAPGGMATDGESVWVADWASGLVWQIDFNQKVPSTPFVVASGLKNPEGLAFYENGKLIVVETGAKRLSGIDLQTGTINTIVEGLELSGPALPGAPPMWYFDGVAVGGSGDVYIADNGKNVILRISGNRIR